MLNTKIDRRAPLSALALLGACPLLAGAAPAGTGVLHVEFSNIRTAKGTVHLDICTEAQFMKDCSISADAPARVGVTHVTVTGLPVGRYAIQAFLDENGNKKVDRGIFGMPKEGVGFSNDAKITFGPPSWKDAVFTATGGEQTLKIRMRYFLGGDTPR